MARKTATAKYVYQVFESAPPGVNRIIYHTPALWNVKRDGRPTSANLEKLVMAYARSLHAGGANAGLSRSLGYIPYPTRAIVRENRIGGRIIGEWRAGMFQVF